MFAVRRAYSEISAFVRTFGPGVSSRLTQGLRAGWAVEFSMLMSVPAICAAALYSALEVDAGWLADTQNVSATLVGTAVAVVVGYFALGLLIKLTTRRRLSRFSYYLWPLGVVLLVLLAIGQV